MNKDLLDQIPVDEQPMASKLDSLIEGLQPSPAFQWDLENRLMDKATTMQPVQGRFTKSIVAVGWGIAAIVGILLLNWTVRSLAPRPSPAAGLTATQPVSFADSVRAGNICSGPIALAHGFDVFLTNKDKTGFMPLDEEKKIGELRSFAWSSDGRHLAILGNTTGSGNIYLTDSSGSTLQPVLTDPGLGYLFDFAWSRDGKQFVAWSAQDNTVLYRVNSDGTGLQEKQMGLHISGAPQFVPDGKSIIFLGADSNSAGLFEAGLDVSRARLINALLEDESGFAFSPDGSRLAYIAMDRSSGRAILMVHDQPTGTLIAVPGSLPIPGGSGSALPEASELSWSADGRSLVFAFGRNATDSAIYLARADGTELIKLVDSAYAPSISADGKCLAYISGKQVLLMDLTRVSAGTTTQPPVPVAELPAGRGIPNFKLDKLKWSP